jgi:predicted transcriptional regulator
VSEHTARRSALSRLVDKLFRGSALRVVTHLVESETLSPEELRALQELLDRQGPAEKGRGEDAGDGPERRGRGQS